MSVADHAHDADLGHGHDEDAAHGSFRSYVIGFILSVVLTVIPFWLIMTGTLTGQAAALTIMALAMVQVVVHMVFFLHLDTKSEGGWNMMALIFTIVILAITLSGSLWVMYNMNANMMPMTAQDASQMP